MCAQLHAAHSNACPPPPCLYSSIAQRVARSTFSTWSGSTFPGGTCTATTCTFSDSAALSPSSSKGPSTGRLMALKW